MAGQGKGNTSGGHRSRHDWVDFAKGFCIVAVVTMWVVGEMQGYVNRGEAGWLGYFAVFAKPFRMPDFFLISGLFLSRVIDRPWRHYLDTKVVHYLYFFVLWTLIVVPALACPHCHSELDADDIAGPGRAGSARRSPSSPTSSARPSSWRTSAATPTPRWPPSSTYRSGLPRPASATA